MVICICEPVDASGDRILAIDSYSYSHQGMIGGVISSSSDLVPNPRIAIRCRLSRPDDRSDCVNATARR
jgi:hypothetical protein